MTYLPAELIKYAISSETQPLSLLIDPQNESTLLVGPEHFLFLSGQYSGDATEARYIEHFQGATVSNLQVEIDVASAFDPQMVSPPMLSLVRRDRLVYIRGLQKGRNGHPDQRILCPLIDQMERSSIGNGVGFYRWRLVAQIGDRSVVVHEVDATPTS